MSRFTRAPGSLRAMSEEMPSNTEEISCREKCECKHSRNQTAFYAIVKEMESSITKGECILSSIIPYQIPANRTTAFVHTAAQKVNELSISNLEEMIQHSVNILEAFIALIDTLLKEKHAQL